MLSEMGLSGVAGQARQAFFDCVESVDAARRMTHCRTEGLRLALSLARFLKEL